MLPHFSVTRSIVVRAAKIALTVGCILAAVNHLDEFMAREFSGLLFVKVVLTFIVPFCVSIYSSVAALRSRDEH